MDNPTDLDSEALIVDTASMQELPVSGDAEEISKGKLFESHMRVGSESTVLVNDPSQGNFSFTHADGFYPSEKGFFEETLDVSKAPIGAGEGESPLINKDFSPQMESFSSPGTSDMPAAHDQSFHRADSSFSPLEIVSAAPLVGGDPNERTGSVENSFGSDGESSSNNVSLKAPLLTGQSPVDDAVADSSSQVGQGDEKSSADNGKNPSDNAPSDESNSSSAPSASGPGNSDNQGNDGIDNGVDAAPPGNPPENDGPGTTPGNPGNSHGNNGIGNGVDAPPPSNPPENDAPGTTPGNNAAGNGEDAAPPGNPPENDGAGTTPGNGHGNNGVGNGEDAAPPGNPPENDGPGTTPGNPGNSHGNNGVGNGEDAAPPGNPPENDGPGTSPGNPGNSHGNNNDHGNSQGNGNSSNHDDDDDHGNNHSNGNNSNHDDDDDHGNNHSNGHNSSHDDDDDHGNNHSNGHNSSHDDDDDHGNNHSNGNNSSHDDDDDHGNNHSNGHNSSHDDDDDQGNGHGSPHGGNASENNAHDHHFQEFDLEQHIPHANQLGAEDMVTIEGFPPGTVLYGHPDGLGPQVGVTDGHGTFYISGDQVGDLYIDSLHNTGGVDLSISITDNHGHSSSTTHVDVTFNFDTGTVTDGHMQATDGGNGVTQVTTPGTDETNFLLNEGSPSGPVVDPLADVTEHTPAPEMDSASDNGNGNSNGNGNGNSISNDAHSDAGNSGASDHLEIVLNTHH